VSPWRTRVLGDDAVELLEGTEKSFAELTATIADWVELNERVATAALREARATKTSSNRRILALLIVAALIAAGVALALTRQVKRDVTVILDRLGHAARSLRQGPPRRAGGARSRRPDGVGNAGHAADRESRA
jgi:hypothetical protein